jgi:hypothetical protein
MQERSHEKAGLRVAATGASYGARRSRAARRFHAIGRANFCERCRDDAKCEIAAAPLDQVALLIEIGMHDPNPKLRRQLVVDLGEHVADARARRAFEAVVRHERDSELVAVAQRALQAAMGQWTLSTYSGI